MAVLRTACGTASACASRRIGRRESADADTRPRRRRCTAASANATRRAGGLGLCWPAAGAGWRARNRLSSGAVAAAATTRTHTRSLARAHDARARATAAAMGGHMQWGGIGRLKGVVSYSLSPYEQRAFAGVIRKVRLCARITHRWLPRPRLTARPRGRRHHHRHDVQGLPNIVRRFMHRVPYVLPGLLLTVSVYSWGKSTHERLHRKQPVPGNAP